MEIKLIDPDDGLENDIYGSAIYAGCHAVVKWCKPTQCRFILVTKSGGNEQAPSDIQDRFIHNILTMYPDATIKTARAVFEGLIDWEAQLAAREAKDELKPPWE